MGTAYTPKCEICGSPALRLDISGDEAQWLCLRHAEGIEEQRVVDWAASRIARIRAASIHEDLSSRSVAYRVGFEGLDESCPYESRSLDSALWRLGSLVALRGAL
jgi:hypothetical protein